MNVNTISKGLLKAIAILIGISLGLYVLYQIKTVLIYLIVAAVISLIARPLLLFFEKRLKFPNTLAVIVTMLFFLSILVGLFLLFIPLINKQSENLSLLNTSDFLSSFEAISIKAELWLKDYNIDVSKQLSKIDWYSNFKTIPNLLNSLIGGLGSFGIGLFSTLFISFFLMKDKYIINDSIAAIFPDKTYHKIAPSFQIIKELLSRYFVGLVMQISILFVIYTIVLLIFGIENAVVISFLCALLNLIPYIGPLIGGVLMFILTMTENIQLDFQTEILPTTVYVMIGYVIAQLIDNFFSQPFIFSKSVKSHPLEIFLIILIAGILFGVIGMVIAIPLYTSIKVILKTFLSENKIINSITKDL